MRALYLICIILFFFSCNKSDLNNVPPCIREIVRDDSQDGKIKTVQAQAVNGEIHFWINTDARHYDGSEIIVNSTCQTVCGYCGECVQGECADLYIYEDWEIVWEK